MRKISILFVAVLLTARLFAQDLDHLTPTPPLGWNSWDCYGPTVVESEVKANADYMAKHLKKFGWEYIVIDIRWYIDNDKAHGYNETDAVYVMDEYGRLQPSVIRFPSAANGLGFKPMGDYIHSKGLKFGIHIMRGIPKEAVKKNTPILGSTAKASEVYNEDRLCTWLKDMYSLDSKKAGAQEYYNSIFKLYASWGLDFVKVDDLSSPYHQEEVEMIRKAIDLSGRKIVLSTSPGETPIANAEHVKKNANMWRIVNDFWDSWIPLKEHFEVCNRWAPHIGNGHFPDADMLPIGRIGIRAENGDDRMSHFTPAEQRTLMSLWSIFRSPLMFGGDLPSSDAATLALITNVDMLNVNQNSANNKQLFRKGDLVAWTADDPKTGDKFLALFNAQDQVPIIENKAIWKSELISVEKKKTSVAVEVDLPKTKKLYLFVSDGENGTFWDQVDWIEPTLSGPNGKLKLTDLKWVKATEGWSKTQVNKSIMGGVLNVDGKDYDNGIGTHAVSMIEYDIPEGYTHFSAIAGMDKACLGHPEGASAKFYVFAENPSGSTPADSVVIPVDFKQLGLKGSYFVKDLWSNKRLGKFSGEFAAKIGRHDAGLYRISKKKVSAQ